MVKTTQTDYIYTKFKCNLYVSKVCNIDFGLGWLISSQMVRYCCHILSIALEFNTNIYYKLIESLILYQI